MKLVERWSFVLGLCVVLFAVAGAWFVSSGRDDTHISTWVVDALGRTGAIVNYNGERVEQSSSLLQVLALAPLAALRLLDSTDLIKLSSIFFGLVTVALTYAVGLRMGGRFVAAGAALLTASAVYFVYWAFSGMETTLVALSVVLLIWACGNFLQAKTFRATNLIWVGLAIAALLMARPEMPIVLGCVLVGLVVVYAWQGKGARTFLQNAVLLFGVFVGCAGALLLFRHWYFGSWVPQPVTAKVDGISWNTILLGWSYLYDQLLIERVVGLEMVWAAGSGIYFVGSAWKHKVALDAYVLIALLFGAAYLSFIVLSGGDWMEAGRFLVPLIPVVSLVSALSLPRIFQSQTRVALAVGVLIVLNLLTVAHYAWRYSFGTPLWDTVALNARYESSEYGWFERQLRGNVREMPTIFYLRQLVERLNPSASQRLTMMSGQMGMISYHMAKDFGGRITFVDRNGLTDRRFTDCVLVRGMPKSFTGQNVPWNFVFDHEDALATQCGILKPDVIFDLGEDKDLKLFRDHGYTIVFEQSGSIWSSDAVFKGREVPGAEFIALRSELVPKLGEWQVAHYDFETQEIVLQ